MGNQKILKTEIAGTIFIILLGIALHFTYSLSNSNPLVGLFSAVNESVWEHLKLAYWPAMFWTLITTIFSRKKVNNFLAARAIGALIMVTFIPAVFYSYTTFTGESILAIDITSFFAAVIVGQLVSYRLFRFRKLPLIITVTTSAALVMLATSFIVFTFYPPHLPIFQDTTTGNYGV
ncbi:MAG: DUF6512 family protein [Candidatus Bathyarchaeota archaeon]|nr:DUF6512 family protein [Candidatus Bathyarchaeota archaeon]